MKERLDKQDIGLLLAEVAASLCDLMQSIDDDPEDTTYSKKQVLALIQAVSLDTTKVMLLAGNQVAEAVALSEEYPDLGVIEVRANDKTDLADNQRPAIKDNKQEPKDDGKVWN